MSKSKIKPTNHDSWILHYHLGRRRDGTPLTVYLMDDGTYEVWHGKLKYLRQTYDEAATIIGHIILANGTRGISL